MRDVAHSPAPPDQAPYAVAEAVFAEAKAYLSSREAQQMSESEIERELHRRGQELMRRLLQGHLDQRTPEEAAGPVEGADDVERSPRRLQERHPETTFGTVQVARVPLAAYTLQHGLASGFEYGPAISALGFCAFYAFAAVLIRRRGRDWMRLLMQSFVALSAAFGTLAIPLAVDGSWTSAAWALEGAAVVWIGARQNRRLALLSGLVLQFLAGCLAIGGQSGDALPVLNRVFLGHLMVSLAGLHSAWSLHRYQVSGLDARLLSVLTLAWGTVWWFGAGSYEISQHLSSVDRHSATLGFLTISVGAYALLRSRLEWKDLTYPPLILLPAMVLLALVWFAETPDLLAHWGALAWPVAFLAQYWILRRLETEWSEVASAYHCGTLYLGVYFVWREALWLSSQLAPGGSAWSFAIPALVPPYFVWGLATFRVFLKWPVERFREIYLGAGQIPLVIATTGCVLAASFLPGDPRPVPYIPLLNPVELAQVVFI